MSFQACDQCSSIKQKCDGQSPCARCLRLDLQCAHLRGRGKQRRDRDDSQSGGNDITTQVPKKYKAVVVRRDKTGCDTCKKRKKKCDELKPKCSDCKRLNLPCTRTPRGPAARRQEALVVGSPPASSISGSSSNSFTENGTSPQSVPMPMAPTVMDLDIVSLDSRPPSLQSQSLYQWLDMDKYPTLSPGKDFDENDDYSYEQAELSFLTSKPVTVSEGEEFFLMDSNASSPSQWVPMRRNSMPYRIDVPPLGFLTNREDQHLFRHYTHIVSKSLCIASADDDNPFLKLMMPLASESHAVMGALLALSAVHLKYNGGYPETVHRGINHQTKAISSLNDLIGAGGSTLHFKEQALATILLLCIIDIREGNSSRWSCHIAAAKTLIVTVGSAGFAQSEHDSSWPFLLDLFEYVDSIITISKCKPPLIDHESLQPQESRLEVEDLTGSAPRIRYNSVFGVARPIFRMIGQISTLSNRRKHRITDDYDRRFRRSAAIIDAKLRAWSPPGSNLPNSYLATAETSSKATVHERELQAASHAALAIKWASILRLHQVVDGYSVPHPIPTECLRHILFHLRHIRIGSSVESQLLFPLIIAGSAALSREDRMEIRSRWLIIERTIGFGNVARAGKMQEKVWEAMDAEVLGEGANEMELGKVAVNWARLRWFAYQELVLF